MKNSIARSCRVGERFALVLDLENLVHGYRVAGLWDEAAEAVARIVRGLRRRGTLVAAVAVADPVLTRRMAVPLGALGVRIFSHAGGTDAADRELVRRLETDVPASCDVVVIGSGDHAFAPIARRLRRRGLRVEIAAVPGMDAIDLRDAVDAVIRLDRVPAMGGV